MIEKIKRIALLFFVLAVMQPEQLFAQNDTLWAAQSHPKPALQWHHPYHQTLTLKLFLSQAEYDGKFKKRDNGKSTVSLPIEQALEVIKKLDVLTLGMPKIIYLVGWQYNGHDSKYPAFFEGNEKLKRPQDKNALESLRWLMKEAKQYHTTVSLHINMFDAYEDSPLWADYVKHDIIAKNADGSLLPGEWGYPISYAQEWKTGFTQKRIDSLCKLLPVQQAGTIHIDAFHTWPPLPQTDANGKAYVNLDKKITSPFLNFTVEDETEAQHKIFEYWASKGIDVTSEGIDFLRISDFAGLQPMAWWFVRSAEDYLRYPASYYTGGVDNGEWGKLFGSSMHAEAEIKKDPVQLTGILENFCLNTAVWFFLNRLDRKFLVQGKDFKKLVLSQNVESGIRNGQYYLTQNNKPLAEGDDVCLPAAWLSQPALLAYSKKGYKNKTWHLPENMRNEKKLEVYKITTEGKKLLNSIPNQQGLIKLSMPASEAYLILPAKK